VLSGTCLGTHWELGRHLKNSLRIWCEHICEQQKSNIAATFPKRKKPGPWGTCLAHLIGCQSFSMPPSLFTSCGLNISKGTNCGTTSQIWWIPFKEKLKLNKVQFLAFSVFSKNNLLNNVVTFDCNFPSPTPQYSHHDNINPN
jgi:hypothetical protein